VLFKQNFNLVAATSTPYNVKEPINPMSLGIVTAIMHLTNFNFAAMNGENRPLVSDGSIEFETQFKNSRQIDDYCKMMYIL